MTTTAEKTKRAPAPDHFDRMKQSLAERLEGVRQELGAAQEELVEAGVRLESAPDAERPEAIKRLASAEKRCDLLHAEHKRLEATLSGLDTRIVAAREQADLERRRAAAREYIRARDEQDVIAAGIVEKMEAVAADVARITELAAVAHKARRNAFGAAGAYVDTAPSLSWIGHHAAAAADRSERRGRHRMDEYASEARRPWRPARGPLAAALAELGL